MLEVEVDDFKYHRCLIDNANSSVTKALKEQFDYSFIVSYGKFDDPDYDIIEKNAAILDLTDGLDLIFSKFNATTRNQIRKFERLAELGVTINLKCDDEFYEFHQLCEKERNWYPIPKAEMENSFLIGTKFNGQYLAGISCYRNDKNIRIGRIFTRRKSDEYSKLTSNDISAASRRIVFELCKWAIDNNLSTVDLGGVSLNEGNKGGITKFKMFFSPEVVPVKIGRFLKLGSEEKKNKLKKSGYDIT